MEKVVTIENLVTEGMVADLRDETPGAAKLIKHFDILTRPRTISPYHSQVNGDTNSAVNRMTDFLFSPVGLMFGVGSNTGSGKTQVMNNQSFTGDTWTALTNGTSPNNLMVPGVFVEYHSFGYGLNSDSTVWKVDLSGATAWNDAVATISSASPLSPSPNGVVHSKDDVLYIAARNVVASNNNGVWTPAALTLPNKYTIVSLCEYGNYLAIGCNSNRAGNEPGIGTSVVYLWDRDSTLNTITEVIDFGTGELKIIEQVEGELIGISLRSDVNANLASKIVFRRYFGTTADVFCELLASTSTGLQVLHGQKQNQRLYFAAGITIDDVLHNGIWGVGKNKQGRWVVWFDRLPDNDVDLAANSLTGFFVIGDMMYISWNDGGYRVSMTGSIDTAYASTSIIETTINPSMKPEDRAGNKDLKVVAVSYDPIPQGGSATLKYKTDTDTFWTTVFTETTEGQIVTERAYDSNSNPLPNGREFRFRFESTGGVMPTSLKYKYEPLATLI